MTARADVQPTFADLCFMRAPKWPARNSCRRRHEI